MTNIEENSSLIQFEAVVFFVGDVERSKRFYTEVLEQKIKLDHGRNVIFESGLSIWDKDYALDTIFHEKRNTIKSGHYNAEIYFESAQLEEIYQNIKEMDTEIIHPIYEHPWGQRAFRFFDPDKHIIEIGEPMSVVILRYYKNGMSEKEIQKKTTMPPEFIANILQNKKY